MPASTTFQWTDANALVQDFVIPTIRTQIFTSHAFFYRARKKIKYFTGGRQIRQVLNWKEEGQGGGWWSGNDVLNTTKVDTLDAAVWVPKNAHVNITIHWEDEQSVKGPEMLQSLMETKSEIARNTILKLINGDLYNNGSNAKAVGGLQHALKDFTDASPDYLASNTYGGITRSGRYDGATIAGTHLNNWWCHHGDATAYTTAGGGGFHPLTTGEIANVIGKMWAQIGIASGKTPTMILSNWGSYTAYHNSLVGQERYNHPQQNNDLASAGFEHVMYKKAAWVVDEQAPRAATTDIEKIYFINEDALRLYVDRAADLSWEPFRKPHNQMLRVGYILWRGELCLIEPRACGVISSVDTTAVTA